MLAERWNRHALPFDTRPIGIYDARRVMNEKKFCIDASTCGDWVLDGAASGGKGSKARN